MRAEFGGIRVERTVQSTLTEAKRVESKLLQDLMHSRFGILKTRENPTFKSYAEGYKEDVTWQKSYTRTVISVNHLIKFFGRKRLTDITDQDFIEYRTKRLKKVSNATVNREYTCLKRMLNIAVKSEKYQIGKNPLDTVKQLREPPVENWVLSREEYRKLLSSAPEYFRRIMVFACHTGMRKMEILHMTFGQLKFWLDRMEVELTNTKSGHREYVPLDPEAVTVVREIAKERNIDLHRMSEKQKDQHVFTGKKGRPLQSVRRPMETTFRRAGIKPRLSTHSGISGQR